MILYPEHRATHPDAPACCGFYWHSNRLARKGTDWIFNEGLTQFQSVCRNGVIVWRDCREILFKFKKQIDQDYRNMLWHFGRGGYCERCTYWDDVYQQYMAHTQSHLSDLQGSSPIKSDDISDAELLAAAEAAMDGATQAS